MVIEAHPNAIARNVVDRPRDRLSIPDLDPVIGMAHAEVVDHVAVVIGYRRRVRLNADPDQRMTAPITWHPGHCATLDVVNVVKRVRAADTYLYVHNLDILVRFRRPGMRASQAGRSPMLAHP